MNWPGPVGKLRRRPLVKPPRMAERQQGMRGSGTLQIGNNRVIIGVVKRLHLREELFDAEQKRIDTDKLFLIGHMAAPR